MEVAHNAGCREEKGRETLKAEKKKKKKLAH